VSRTLPRFSPGETSTRSIRRPGYMVELESVTPARALIAAWIAGLDIMPWYE
jgi:hypothetical protein